MGNELSKLRAELLKLKDDVENWDEDQLRSFNEELLPELKKGVDGMAETAGVEKEDPEEGEDG